MVSPQENWEYSNPIIDSFRLVAETHRQVSEVTQKAKAMVKETYKNPQDLADTIERLGTPVYHLPPHHWFQPFLLLLGFEPGFIAPACHKRFQVLIKLLRWIDPKTACSFQRGVFILTPSLFTVGFLAHQLHHWLACQSGLSGYDDVDQARYRSFWEKQGGVLAPALVERMSVEEIVSLKSAINRDLEALAFLRQLVEEIFVPSNQGKNLRKGTAMA